MYNFFSSNRVLPSLQSGFVPGDSTVNQLMSTYDVFCKKALDDGKEVRSVFCDISKAVRETEICLNRPRHMTNIATKPIYGKTF